MGVGLLVMFFFLRGTLSIKYDVDKLKETYMDDSEPRITWKEPEGSKWATFRGENEDADKLGLLLTGISEFSWIVDLRVDKADEERWSTGNLISYKHVLTTCRAASMLESDSQSSGNAIKITFTQQYLWEYVDRLKRYHDTDEYVFGGTRLSQSVYTHPQCRVMTSTFDAAILVLSYGIQPALPIIGYMPIIKDYLFGYIPTDLELSYMEGTRLVCHVASIGRNYLNVKKNLVLDFKVKHRVYWEDFAECAKMVRKMCEIGPDTRYCGPMKLNSPERVGNKWMCFRTRAKVGTVCDHDRGAPLVCKGEVYGIVVMGALKKYCNDLLPVQFVVAKITQFREYFEQFVVMKPAGKSGAVLDSYISGINVATGIILLLLRSDFIFYTPDSFITI